jgi:hypothetical protein
VWAGRVGSVMDDLRTLGRRPGPHSPQGCIIRAGRWTTRRFGLQDGSQRLRGVAASLDGGR